MATVTDSIQADPGSHAGSDFFARGETARLNSSLRRHSRGPLPPLSFTARREDGGITFKIIDRDPIADANGAVRYDVYWCQDLSLQSDETVAAG
jgi:hypothetical protein